MKKNLLTKSEKKKVWTRDKNTCRYCRKKLQEGEKTVDHVISRRNGGTNDISNLVTACYPCNNKKSFIEQPPIKNKKHAPNPS